MPPATAQKGEHNKRTRRESISNLCKQLYFSGSLSSDKNMTHSYVHIAKAGLPICSGEDEATSTLKCHDGVTHTARASELQTVAALMPAMCEEETPRN